MPEGLTVPAWYNDNNYINEKVNECNTIKFGAVEGEEFTPWTADSVRDFMAQVNNAESYAPWMGYDNFVESGNAENCSPNPLFNVMEYVYAKADQLNAMNEGAGYGEHGNHWNGALVLKFFNDNNITAWDHFTTAGQFENVNPSNAMDLSAFLTSKAAECNEIEFDGRTDWDEQAVLDYYAQHELNAVMVAEGASDPLVVEVPEADQVTVPANVNPWGIGVNLFDVNLTTANDVISDEGIPTNFIGEVATSASKSTLNPGDQITGTDVNDELTIAMNGVWSGFRGDGFMKGVPTVNIDNATDNRDLSFYANGIEGVTTYNVDGNVSLYNLDQAGIAVNLSNVDTNAPINLSFTKEAIKGKDDNLTLGLDNVRIPLRDVDPDGHLRYNPVNIDANDIEHLTVNSTGSVENRVDLSGIDTAKDITVTGDADLHVSATGSYLKTIDGTAATGDVSINAAPYGSFIEKAAFGSGDDTLTVFNIRTDAEIDGGDGNDTLVMGQGGVYQFAMNGVEEITAHNTNRELSLDGSNTQGLETLNLSGQGADTTLTNFGNGILNVNAWGSNPGNLTVTDIPEIAMTVGDGRPGTSESFTGTLTANDAQNISITTESNTGGNRAVFNSDVVASNARSLMLNGGQDSSITIGNGSNLAQVDQIQIGGNGGAIVIDGNVATEANSLYVNAQNLVGGGVTADFGANAENDGVLNYYGTNTGTNNITVDGTYADVNFYGGANNDVLTINGTAADGSPWTVSNLTGDLGVGTDKLVVKGKPFVTNPDGSVTWSNFSAFTGVEALVFTDPDAVNWPPIPAACLPAGLTSATIQPEFDVNGGTVTETGTTGDDSFVLDITPDSKGGDVTLGGAGGNDTVSGTVDNAKTNLTLDGGTGSLNVTFGTGPGQLNVQDVASLDMVGGTGTDDGSVPNSLNGTINLDTAPVSLNAEGVSEGTGNIDLTVDTAGDVTVNGFNGEGSTYDVTVTAAANVNLNSGNAENAQIAVQNATGTVNATTGAGNDNVSVQNAAGAVTVNAGAGNDNVSVDVTNDANNPNITTGAGNDTITVDVAEGLATAITLNPGDGEDTITVTTADGAAKSVALTGTVTANDTLNVNLTGKTLDLSGLEGTYKGTVTLQGTAEASTLTGGDGNDVLISGPVSFGWDPAPAGEATKGDAVFTLAGTPDWTKAGTVVFDPDGAAGKAEPITVTIDASGATDAATLATAIQAQAAKFTGFTVKADNDTITITQSDASAAATDISTGATLEVKTAIVGGSAEFTLVKAEDAAVDAVWTNAGKVTFDADGDPETPNDQITVDVTNETNTAAGLANAIQTAVAAVKDAAFTAEVSGDKITFTPTDPATTPIGDAPTLTVEAKAEAGSAEFTLAGAEVGKAYSATFDADGDAETKDDQFTVWFDGGQADADALALAIKNAADAETDSPYTVENNAANVTFTPADVAEGETPATIGEDATLTVNGVTAVGKATFDITATAGTEVAALKTVVFDPDGDATTENVKLTVTGIDNTSDADAIASAIKTAADAVSDLGYTVEVDGTTTSMVIFTPKNPHANPVGSGATLSFLDDSDAEIASAKLDDTAVNTKTDDTPLEITVTTDSPTPTIVATVAEGTVLPNLADPADLLTNAVETDTNTTQVTGLTSDRTGGAATIPAPGAVEAQEGVTDTLTGGKGDDTFVVQLAATAINAETVTPNVTPNPTVIITDFGTGEETKGNDTLVFGSSAGSTTAVSATTDATDYGSVAALVQAALTALDGTNNAFIGTSGGNTYVAYGAQAGQMTALVQLTGVTIGNVDAADIFVGAAGA